MFVDQATIRVKGGAGGAGAAAFRREKGVPRGGPSGGSGGTGGDVVLTVDPQLDTLLDYSYRENYEAGRAGHGEGSNRTGADGDDLLLPVPPGTVVSDAESGERLGDLLDAGDRVIVARGGRGGRGNASFATATRRAPRRWEPGEWGEERRIRLELKLIADVGLVGEPNAGKSTLLAALTAAHPRIAEYPFTTLSPNLGVVALSGGRSFIMADIPGIIEGAHEGKGLGTRFLRHIERTRTLALLIPVDDAEPERGYERLRRELRQHDPALSRLPHCVVLTKTDLLPKPEDGEAPVAGPVPLEATDAGPSLLEATDAWGSFTVSAVTHAGLEGLGEALWAHVAEERRRAWGRRDPAEPGETGPAGRSAAPRRARVEEEPGSRVPGSRASPEDADPSEHFPELDEWIP